MSTYAELRLQCTVTSILEIDDGVVVSYTRQDGTEGSLKSAYLVGADGKRGFVRKEYLEAKGIEQIPGLYEPLYLAFMFWLAHERVGCTMMRSG